MDLNKIKEYLTTAKEKGQLTYPYSCGDSWLVKEAQDVLQYILDNTTFEGASGTVSVNNVVYGSGVNADRARLYVSCLESLGIIVIEIENWDGHDYEYVQMEQAEYQVFRDYCAQNVGYKVLTDLQWQ
jgi:hypothetical protein